MRCAGGASSGYRPQRLTHIAATIRRDHFLMTSIPDATVGVSFAEDLLPPFAPRRLQSAGMPIGSSRYAQVPVKTDGAGPVTAGPDLRVDLQARIPKDNLVAVDAVLDDCTGKRVAIEHRIGHVDAPFDFQSG